MRRTLACLFPANYLLPLCRLWALACLALLPPAGAIADEVEMQNGDRYVGKITSVDTDTVVLQSEVLGAVKLPRGTVSAILFGPKAAGSVRASSATNQIVRAPWAGSTNSAMRGATAPQPGGSASEAQQVQEQLLREATPEAKAKYNELMGGLMSGKLSVDDIRSEAKAAADQLRALKGDAGEGSAPELDSYLAILDKFVAESASGSSTNRPVSAPAAAEDK
jgi:hypothetical protein